MNQYMAEQALLYMNDLKAKEAAQKDAKHPECIRQKSKVLPILRFVWSCLLSVMSRLIRERRVAGIVRQTVKPSRHSS